MSKVVPIRRTWPSHGLIHVLRHEDGRFEVLHESASGESFALLALFDADERDAAVKAAVDAPPTYAPCKLGRAEQ